MKSSLLLFLLISFQVFAEELAEPYISEGACPFEGCKYGKWHVQKETNVYLNPDKKSKTIGLLKPDRSITALTGNVHVYAGIAKIIGEPYMESKKLKSDQLVYILDYVGEGFTRIYQNGDFFITVIATSKNECEKLFGWSVIDWRACWVEVIKEPESFWWVKIKFNNSVGWVLIENENIKPIDTRS